MLILHFVDFEETQEIDQSQQIQVVIEEYVQEKKLPINIKYHIFDENEEINSNQIVSGDYEENKKIFILFILPQPVIFYFQESEEQYQIEINLFDKIETLTQKLKQRFGLLGYSLELKYQNLDQNKSFYEIDKNVSKIQCKVTQKINVQYQNKERELSIDMFIRIFDLYKYLKEQFKIQQNFKILYNDNEIKLDTQCGLIQYQIPTGAELRIHEIKKISVSIINEVTNQNQKMALDYDITVIEVIQQITKFSKLQGSDNYQLYNQNVQLRNDEQINKFINNSNQIFTFKQKIYDVEFYLCQQGIEFSKLKLRMKSNETLVKVCQQSYFKNKKIKFFYQNIEINPNNTLQQLKIIDQTTLQYQEIIEENQIEKPPIVQTEPHIEFGFQFNGQIRKKQIKKNQILLNVKQEILLMFGIKQNFDKYYFRYQNSQIIEQQGLEIINYKQNDLIEIYNELEPKKEVIKEQEAEIMIELENEITNEKQQVQVKLNEKILDFKERLNFYNYTFTFKRKELRDDVVFGDRGIKNGSIVYFSVKRN